MPLDHFSLVAPIYDRVFNGVIPSDRLRALLDLPAQGWLLDAGGGTGRVSGALRDQVGGVAVVDYSPGMLAQAGRKNGLAQARARVQRLPSLRAASRASSWWTPSTISTISTAQRANCSACSRRGAGW
ncbi:MAG: class I SAM-dependent methyltransferase [Anaerolineae bacterium]|nr:class I SAM-dependent methyltransferase [Anaerolineae bacterium]